MAPLLKMAALGGIVLLSYTTQAMTGFGSTVIALALGAHFFPINDLLPVIVALNIPMCVVLVARHRAAVDAKVLRGAILPWMGLGMALGLAAAGLLRGAALRQAFGALVVLFAARELAALCGALKPQAEMGAGAFRFWVAAAGVVHGVSGSGGPVLTYALSRRKLDRSALRATLLAVWLIFNAAVLAACLWRGDWTSQTGWRALVLLPVVPLGILLGERLHALIPERGFQLAVQSVLVVSGAALLI